MSCFNTPSILQDPHPNHDHQTCFWIPNQRESLIFIGLMVDKSAEIWLSWWLILEKNPAPRSFGTCVNRCIDAEFCSTFCCLYCSNLHVHSDCWSQHQILTLNMLVDYMCQSISRCGVLLELFMVVPFQFLCSHCPSISTSNPDRWSNCGKLSCSGRLAMPPTFFFSSPNVVVYQQKLTKIISLGFSDDSQTYFNPPSFELRQSFDLATSFRIAQVTSYQDHPHQSVHWTCIRLSSSYNKTNLYF